MFARVCHAGARLLNTASDCVNVESSSRGVICKPVGEQPQKDEVKERAVSGKSGQVLASELCNDEQGKRCI